MIFRWIDGNLGPITEHGITLEEIEAKKKNMKKRTKRSEYERFTALSDDDKNREVARYDHTMPRGRPLTAAQKALHAGARRLGRPRIGKGAKTIALTVERDLLRRADAWAKHEGISRAQLMARGLLAVLPG